MRASALCGALLACAPASALAQLDIRALDAISLAPVVLTSDPLVVEVELDQPSGAYSGPIDVRIRLSADATPDPTDPIAFTQTVSITATTSAVQVAGAVPKMVGDYFLVADLDPDDLILESDKSNNTVVGSLVTLVGGDLELTLLAPTGRSEAFEGQSFSYRVDFRNRGPASVDGAELVVTFRPRASAAVEVLRTAPETLGPNATRTRTESFEVPVGTSTGAAELTARVSLPDPIDPDPLNDIRVLGVDVRPPAPDLSGEIITTSTVVEAGQQLVVNRVVENGGFVDAPATEILYVLSEDDELRPTDLNLGRAAIPALAVDEIDVDSDRFDLALTLAPGNYRLGFIIDPDGLIAEVDEGNAVLGPRIDVFAPDLQIATESLPVARIGVPYEVALIAVGGTDPNYVWSLVQGSAPGIELEANTGILSGTPTAEGEFELQIRVESGTARSERSLSLRVVAGSAPLELDDIDLPAAILNRSYDVTLVPRGGIEPYAWRALTVPPASLVLAADGRLSGVVTETSTGARAFDVEVRDAVGAVATAEARLTLVELSQGVTLLPDPLPNGVVGRPYCDPTPVQLRAEGDFPPFVFSSAFAPEGLSVAEDGRLCGTPTRVGTSTFTVNVRDAVGLVDTAVFQLEVENDDSVRFVTDALPDAVVAEFYEAAVQVEGGVTPYRFDVTVDALPPGLELEPSGRIIGTPTTVGRYQFALRATDARGASGLAGFGITVFIREDDEGCSCRSTSTGSDGVGLALGVLLALGLALRRRRA